MLCQISERSCVLNTPAKLNLLLRVLSRRVDGFHAIESVMTRVSLFDTLKFERLPHGELTLQVRRASEMGAFAGSAEVIPSGPENLVLKAALLLQATCGTDQGASIELIKRIPSAAGMGGGSSDAAAALIGLNHLWNLGLPAVELMTLGAQLGSDVPFFLMKSATAVARGRGEVLEPIDCQGLGWFVVVKPMFGLSTAAVYRVCTPRETGPGAQELIAALTDMKPAKAKLGLQNDLQAPAMEIESRIHGILHRLRQEPVRAVQMTGSGSACFAWCHSRQQASGVAARLRAAGLGQVFIVAGGV